METKDWQSLSTCSTAYGVEIGQLQTWCRSDAIECRKWGRGWQISKLSLANKLNEAKTAPNKAATINWEIIAKSGAITKVDKSKQLPYNIIKAKKRASIIFCLGAVVISIAGAIIAYTLGVI